MNESTVDRNGRSYFQAVLRRFGLYFLTATTIIVTILVYFEYRDFRVDRDNLTTQESLRMELASQVLVHDLKHVVVDVLTIASMEGVHTYVESGNPQSRNRLERFFLSLAVNQGFYDQIRFIDNSGRERIRVNYKDGVAFSTPAEKLQDKSSRYYFKQAMQLGPNEIYISPLDLNVENGKIEKPYKPTLRVATPIFDSDGNRRGILVLNYLAEFERKQFQDVMVNSWGQPMIVNTDGHWLYSPSAEDEWGFVLGHGRSFDRRFPQAWKAIQAQDNGVVQTPKGLFVFNTLRPARLIKSDTKGFINIPQTGQSVGDWKLISHIPPQQSVFGISKSLYSNRALLFALIVLSAIASLLLANLRARNRIFTRQLRDSEQRNRLLLDSVGEGIFGVDLDGMCTFINPGAMRILGYRDPADLIQKPIHQLIHHTGPDGSPCTEQECKIYSAFREGASFHTDNEYMYRADGTAFPVEYWSTPIFEKGRITGAVAAFIDITRRKQAEDALQREHDELETRVHERTAELQSANVRLTEEINERERVQQALIEERNFVSAILSTVGALVIVLDARGSIVRFNKACEQVTGYRFEEVRGRIAWDILLIDSEVEPVKKVFAQLTAGDFPTYYENYWITKTGEHRLIAWSNTALVNHDTQKVEFVIATGIDITERKQAEEALRNSENQLRLITDNLPVLIGYLDAGRRYRFNNRAYEKWFDISREDVYGRHIRDVIGETAYLAVKDKIDQALSGVEVHFESIVPYKTAGERYVSAAYIPDINEQGQVKGFFVFIQDITERKQAEDKARQHQDELAHITRVTMMGELATELAHELNQPLTAIHSYAETALMMAEEYSKSEIGDNLDHALDGIRNQAQRASKIINHLREFVRKREVNTTYVDLNQLINNVIEFVEPELTRYGIKLKIAGAPDLPAVKADSIQIEQVLLNLLRNSIQAMASSGRASRELTIRTSTSQDNILVQVADTGPGMDADTLNDIFKPFVSTKGAAGMGIGLSISRSILEAHNGDIWAESQPGQGATFYFSLPIDLQKLSSRHKTGKTVHKRTVVPH